MYKELMEKSKKAYETALKFKDDDLMFVFWIRGSIGFRIKANLLFNEDMRKAKNEEEDY